MEDFENFNVRELTVKVIPSDIAKKYTLRYHYMKTMPNAMVCFGVFYKRKLSGVITFGRGENTAKKIKAIIPNINDNEYLEMQRMNILDICGKNSESYVLGQIMKLLKDKGIKAVITHSGGCKNDCGIVYQSSSWLYFGKEECKDFYLTQDGKFENLSAKLRFGQVPNEINRQGRQKAGEFLFGAGELINSYRYTYIYPIQKGLRKYLEKKCLPYPKDSAVFRKNGEWCD